MENSCFKVIGCGVIGVLFFGALAQAEPTTTFKTSIGFVFEVNDDPGFERAIKAPDGTVWSTYQGLFTNRGPVTNGQVVASPAVEQCAKIGGLLPRSGDFLNLRSYFAVNFSGHGYSLPYTTLTATGAAEILRLFTIPSGESTLWSRIAVMPMYSAEAFEILNAGPAGAPNGALRLPFLAEPHGVICIKR